MNRLDESTLPAVNVEREFLNNVSSEGVRLVHGRPPSGGRAAFAVQHVKDGSPVFLLRRGFNNRIIRMRAREAIIPRYCAKVYRKVKRWLISAT